MSVAVAKGKPVESAQKGLKGVIAADSAVCDIDGDAGKLIYRGYNIHELAEQSTFEEVCYLLLNAELPTALQARGLFADAGPASQAAPAGRRVSEDPAQRRAADGGAPLGSIGCGRV